MSGDLKLFIYGLMVFSCFFVVIAGYLTRVSYFTVVHVKFFDVALKKIDLQGTWRYCKES